MEQNVNAIHSKACRAMPDSGLTQACTLARVQGVYDLLYLPVLVL